MREIYNLEISRKISFSFFLFEENFVLDKLPKNRYFTMPIFRFSRFEVFLCRIALNQKNLALRMHTKYFLRSITILGIKICKV